MMEAFLHYSGYNYSIQREICQEKTTAGGVKLFV